MTLEEIRMHKEKTEQDIRCRLLEFFKLTGMCPIALKADAYTSTQFCSDRLLYSVGDVVIELEPI